MKKEISAKNHADAIDFTRLFVPQASQSSHNGRAESEIQLAISSTQSACGMEIIMKIGEKNFQFYAITDRRWLNGKDFYKQVEDVLKNGATFLQLREKDATHEQIVEEGLKLKPIAAKYGVPFVINDDCIAAKEINADGVHIGQSDISYQEARKILGPDKIIGMTAKNAAQAVRAQELGADYIGVGAVFHTQTKKDAVDMDMKTLLEITEKVSIPVVAIGGITYDNCDLLADSGVSGAAVISAVFAQEDVANAALKMAEKTKKLFGKTRTYKNIIFDMDGTIIDSMPFWRSVPRDYVGSFGIEPPEDFDIKMFIKSIDESVAYMHDEVGINRKPDEIKTDILELIGEHYKNDIPLKKGMKEQLRKESDNGCRMCIFTASDKECAAKALKRLDVAQYFERIYTVDEIGINKHDGASYLKVCELSGFDTSETCVYEDAVHGLKSAQSAGLQTVAVFDKSVENTWQEEKLIADEIFI